MGRSKGVRPASHRKLKRSVKRRSRPRTDTFPRASEVTITKRDGTITTEPALTYKQLAVVVKERRSLTPKQKASVLRRDKGTCRYCGIYCHQGNIEFDHVIPVAVGGPTTVRNIVTSCVDCNQKKGKKVWKPRPIR